MDGVTTITTGELLEALAAAARGNVPEDARTVNELSEASGVSIRRVRAALALLNRVGRLESFQVVRPALDGRASRVPAYTIRPAATG